MRSAIDCVNLVFSFSFVVFILIHSMKMISYPKEEARAERKRLKAHLRGMRAVRKYRRERRKEGV